MYAVIILPARVYIRDDLVPANIASKPYQNTFFLGQNSETLQERNQYHYVKFPPAVDAILVKETPPVLWKCLECEYMVMWELARETALVTNDGVWLGCRIYMQQISSP